MDEYVVIKPIARYYDATDAMLHEVQKPEIPVEILRLETSDDAGRLITWLKRVIDEEEGLRDRIVDAVYTWFESMLDLSPRPNSFLFRLFVIEDEKSWIECQAYVYTSEQTQMNVF